MTVNHDKLIEKLLFYGVRGLEKNWFRSFLNQRKQYVSINGFNSDTETIRCGVPQGSTLGPLLFIIYINDLAWSFSNCIIQHFADDTNLLFGNKDLKVIESVMNKELRILVDWLKANKLSLNESKTELLIFH